MAVDGLGLTLLIICLSDLSWTALGVHFGWLNEGNPMLNYFLSNWDLSGFILVKLFFVIVPILIFEIMRKHNPEVRRRIRAYYRFLIFAYLSIFTAGSLFQFIF
jgi:hypothetical protein